MGGTLRRGTTLGKEFHTAGSNLILGQRTLHLFLAGDDLLSQVVNAAIGFKPLFSVMKVAAKQVVQRSAEKCGVPWRQRVKDLTNTPEVSCVCSTTPSFTPCSH